ncbi:hypothetical protein VB773_06205 [Haloarculaceae archaeon H-GB2-1]|nr:hypothetical protein [Haloarculaceae archaeon H-GB1-1]MEA5385703.1 hypothetical protein [Haloarculaceae archaeon H-GB11]MEA5407204.1 hypothetical protein [Haloarculaceae archaeon H-GB2-1]
MIDRTVTEPDLGSGEDQTETRSTGTLLFVLGSGFAVVFAGLAYVMDVPPTPVPILAGVAIVATGLRVWSPAQTWLEGREALQKRRTLLQLAIYGSVFALFGVVPTSILYPFLWTLTATSATSAFVGAYRTLGGS